MSGPYFTKAKLVQTQARHIPKIYSNRGTIGKYNLLARWAEKLHVSVGGHRQRNPLEVPSAPKLTWKLSSAKQVNPALRFERFLTLWYFGVKNDNRRPADEGTSVTQTQSGRVKWPVQAAGILLILASPWPAESWWVTRIEEGWAEAPVFNSRQATCTERRTGENGRYGSLGRGIACSWQETIAKDATST